jgi:tetratricopeptide (TPR) repeat protein
LAELFTTSPDATYWNAVKAVPHARKAVQLDPEPGGCWNTLGIVYYRMGDWEAAIRALEKSMELRRGGDCYDWFFLSMAHSRLDHRDEAQQWYEQAVAWMKNHHDELVRDKPKSAQLCRFHGEAASVLGLKPERSDDR